EGFSLAVPGGVGGGVREEFQREDAIVLAVEPPFDRCVRSVRYSGSQHGKVLQAIRAASDRIRWMIERHTIITQVDPQAGVGDNGIPENGIASARFDGYSRPVAEGDDIAGTRIGATDGVVRRVIPNQHTQT